MKFKFLLAVATVTMLSACGGSGDSKSNDQLDLDGTWVSNCYLDGEDIYTIDKFIYLNNTLEYTDSTFDNSSCSGDPIAVSEITGTFVIGNTIQTSSGLEAVELTYDLFGSNQNIVFLDILRQEGDTFNYGVSISNDTFPTELNFDVLLTRQ